MRVRAAMSQPHMTRQQPLGVRCAHGLLRQVCATCRARRSIGSKPSQGRKQVESKPKKGASTGRKPPGVAVCSSCRSHFFSKASLAGHRRNVHGIHTWLGVDIISHPDGTWSVGKKHYRSLGVARRAVTQRKSDGRPRGSARREYGSTSVHAVSAGLPSLGKRR